MSPRQPAWVSDPEVWAWTRDLDREGTATPEQAQRFADTILNNGGTPQDLRGVSAAGARADSHNGVRPSRLSGLHARAAHVAQARAAATTSPAPDESDGLSSLAERADGLGHDMRTVVAIAAHRLERDDLLPGSGSGLDQGPSQRQQADVREVVTDANAVQTDTGQMPGGDGDSRAARDASLRASTSLTQAQAASASRPAGRASTAAMTQQQRQQLAATATLAAREKVHTDRVREDAEDDQRVRDDVRDYPSMDQRTAQRDTGRAMGMGR